ncbi:efflux transporter outer membrane subunit [Phenylobacterium sp.]|uniref:efflux transporter outer membrane subunit n=1 Tax=Phenylobacterium sp. TaxID=1871053 RepID=UPI00273004AC|nr:TolC family protein [Phenylobacterium sp.]MDP2213205.1 TolC family protein [Phenylobacterium sp.]
MIPSRLAALFAGAALLSACAAGPNYQAPLATASETGPFVAAGEGPFTAAPIAEDWWRLYEDPLLDDLVAQAFSANRDIAVAAANLAQVRATLGEARVGFLPSTATSGEAARVRQQNPATGAFAEGDSFQAGFEAAYEVDFFGRVRRSVEAARADAGAAQALLDSARVTVAAETARAYADLCAANLQIATAQQTLDLQQESADLTGRQFELGRGAGLDVARAQTELESTRATLPPLEAQRDSALFRLAVLTGRPPAQAPIAAMACNVVPEVTTAIPVGDGAALLARRPDVRAAERRLAAATARIGVATASLYPTVTLGGSISTQAADAANLGDDYQFSVGPLISWSFPNILAARARISQAGAGADAALASFEQVNLTALQETETALTQYAKALDRRAALQRARDQGERAARLSRMRYEAGVDSFLGVLDAERTLAGLQAQLALSQAQVADAQIALFRALGGGWAPAAS